MGFRALKLELSQRLIGDDWETFLPEIVALPNTTALGALFSLLPGRAGGHPELTWRAAVALGHVVAALAAVDMEEARICMRRFMWHMNEESGNIGWGIPEAMGEVFVQHEGLAKDYARILLSYVWDTGIEDNFCDHGPLRQSTFNALGRMIVSRFPYVKNAAGVFVAGLQDAYIPARGAAAFALYQLCMALRRLDSAEQQIYFPALLHDEALRFLDILLSEQASLSLFIGSAFMTAPVSFFAQQARATVRVFFDK